MLPIAEILFEDFPADMPKVVGYEAKWLEDEFRKRGLKLDRGKACLRFKSLDDLPLDVIGEVIASVPPKKYIEIYQASRKKTAKGK